MTFAVEDEAGALLASGTDLAAVREQVRPRLRAALSAATAEHEHTGLTSWSIDVLPREIALRAAGEAGRAFPALVDRGDHVDVKMMESRAAQDAAMRGGTRRLLLLTIPSPARHVAGQLGNRAQLLLAGAPHGSLAAVVEDATAAAADALIDEAGGPAWDADGFARLRDHVAGSLADRTVAIMRDVVAILRAPRRPAPAHGVAGRPTAARRSPGRRRAARPPGLPRVHHGNRCRAPARHRPLPPAADRRLERLPDAVAVDRDRMSAVRALEAEQRERIKAYVSLGRPVPRR